MSLHEADVEDCTCPNTFSDVEIQRVLRDHDEQLTTVEAPITEAAYTVFSRQQRNLIIALVCFAGFLSPLSSLLYTPALPTIAADLGVSISAVNLTITTYLIFQGITPSLWGTLGDSHGRRLLYIVTSIISAGACIGLSITNSYGAVLALRALQAAGCSSTRALGAGVIRDLTPPRTRGGYMGIYSAGVGVGTAFGPLLGGILAEFAGWHAIFYFLFALSVSCLIPIILFLPETLHGIVGNGSRLPPKHLQPPIRWLCPSLASEDDTPLPPKPKVDILGPLRLLMHFDVFCCVSFTGICYTVWQNSMVATSTLYSSRYHLSQVQIGLTYISNGVGSLVGNVVTGRALDYDYKKQLARENHNSEVPRSRVVMIEHARLLSLRVAAPVFAAGIIIFGWVVQSHAHIAVSITIAFFIGWFDSSILTTYSTLMVDLFEQHASASSAIINLVRCILGAVGTSTIEPMIKALDVGWTFTTLGGLCLAALPIIWIQYRYGSIWRRRRVADNDRTSSVETKTVSDLEIKLHSSFVTISSLVKLPHDSVVSDHSPPTYGTVDITIATEETVASLSNSYIPSSCSSMQHILLAAVSTTISRITGCNDGVFGLTDSEQPQARLMSYTYSTGPTFTPQEIIRHAIATSENPNVTEILPEDDIPYLIVVWFVSTIGNEALKPSSSECEWHLMQEGGSIKLRFFYAQGLFSVESAERYARELQSTLDTFLRADCPDLKTVS